MYRVYGYDTCQYCQKAKALLESEGQDFTFTDIPLAERKSFMDDMGFTGDERTFPRIWGPGGEHIGGFSELEMYLLTR